MMAQNQEKRIKPKGLTQKQFDCLEYYIKYGNLTKAAVEAGYAKKGAAVAGYNVINSKKGQAYLSQRMNEIDNEKIADANEVLEFLTSVMRGEVNDQFDLDPSLADRTKAAVELAKRQIDAVDQSQTNVTIICDIPKPDKKTLIAKNLAQEEDKQNE